MKQSPILVAGANGNNGRELIAQLTAEKIPVRALVRNESRASIKKSEMTELVEADLLKPESLAPAFAGIERAFIAAPIHSESVTLFENFFNAAKAAGIRHIVKLSGFGAGPASKSEILRQHAQSDDLLSASGLNFTIVQPNSFFQNILWQRRSIRLKNRFALPLGDSRQSWVDIRDVAEATVKIFSTDGHANRIYRLTGPERLSCHDIAGQLSNQLDKPIRYKPISPESAETEMLASGVPKWNAHALAEIQQVFASEDFSDTTDDIALILGRPARRFSAFAADYASYFR